MKRLAALFATLLLASCGSGGDPKPDPGPGKTGGGGSEPPVEMNLEAECAKAAEAWKTYRAVYQADGGTSATVSLAMDRSGRVSLKVDPGAELVLDGGILTTRIASRDGKLMVARVPMGRVFASIEAMAASRAIPERGPDVGLPPGHVGVDLVILPGEGGRPERHAQLAISLSPIAPFGWLDILHPHEGITVRAEGRDAVASGPPGRVLIDRDTGGLRSWTLETEGGAAVRLLARELVADAPLDPAFFALKGDEAPRLDQRRVILRYVIMLAGQALQKERDLATVLTKIAVVARCYYRCAWTDGDLAGVAATASARRAEKAGELRRQFPELSAADIDTPARAAGMSAAESSVQDELRDDMVAFVSAFQLQELFKTDRDSEEKFRTDMTAVVTEELLDRVERLMGSK